MLAWAKSSPVLAVGTVKGNLQLFHTKEMRRSPIVGKHTKKVCNGVWTKDDILAMASLDKTVGAFISSTAASRLMAHPGCCCQTTPHAWRALRLYACMSGDRDRE